MKLTEEQEQILRHTTGSTTGIDPQRHGYRNHFVTGEGHAELLLIMELVEMGLMIQTPTPSFLYPDDKVFRVTQKGLRLLNVEVGGE